MIMLASRILHISGLDEWQRFNFLFFKGHVDESNFFLSMLCDLEVRFFLAFILLAGPHLCRCQSVPLQRWI